MCLVKVWMLEMFIYAMTGWYLHFNKKNNFNFFFRLHISPAKIKYIANTFKVCKTSIRYTHNSGLGFEAVQKCSGRNLK